MLVKLLKIYALFIVVLLSSCDSQLLKSDFDTPSKELPAGVKPITILEQKGSTIKFGSGVTDAKGCAIIECGVLLSKIPDPTVTNAQKILTVPNPAVGDFIITFNDLTSETEYYVRGYALNANGVTYGETLKFKSAYISPFAKMEGTYLVQEMKMNGTPNIPYEIEVILRNATNQEGIKSEYFEILGLGTSLNGWNKEAVILKAMPMINGNNYSFLILSTKFDINHSTVLPSEIVNARWVTSQSPDKNIFGMIDMKNKQLVMPNGYCFMKVEAGNTTSSYYHGASMVICIKK